VQLLDLTSHVGQHALHLARAKLRVRAGVRVRVRVRIRVRVSTPHVGQHALHLVEEALVQRDAYRRWREHLEGRGLAGGAVCQHQPRGEGLRRVGCEGGGAALGEGGRVRLPHARCGREQQALHAAIGAE